jgi:Na+/melibiose symporter-like transporter
MTKLSWPERRALALLGMPTFGLALAATIVSTYLPVFLRELSGPIVIGVMIGSEGVFGLSLSLVVGPWSDTVRSRLGRRLPFMIAGTLPAALALVFMPLARSLLALLVLLGIFYIGYFTYYAPYRALYPDLVPREDRARSQGAQKTWREIGLGVALVSGGFLMALFRPLPFLLAAALLVVTMLAFVAWRVHVRARGHGALEAPEEAEDHGDSHESGAHPLTALRRVRGLVREAPNVKWLLAGNALWEAALAALKTFVVLYVTVGLGQSSAKASGALAVVAASVLVAALATGVLADRFGSPRLMRYALWVYGLGLVIPAFVHSYALVFVLPFVAFAAAVVMTLPYAILMGMLKEEHHGTASGIFELSRALGALVGPASAGLAVHFLAGWMDDTKGYGAVFLVASAFILASIPCAVKLGRATEAQGEARA